MGFSGRISSIANIIIYCVKVVPEDLGDEIFDLYTPPPV